MAKVIYVNANDERTEVEIEPGETVMSLAVNNLVDGIVGECGELHVRRGDRRLAEGS